MPDNNITTAIFPVAGLGTRFLPITKAGPKEMLPIVNKPVIQYVVEEAIAAGIKHLVFITSSGKRAIEDFFDSNYELEKRLQNNGNKKALSLLTNIIPNDVKISYVRQTNPCGLGNAIMCAAHLINSPYFSVLLPDDIIDYHDENCLAMMINLHNQHACSIIASKQVPPSEINQYGILETNSATALSKITQIVEKPKLGTTTSNLAVTGRYILSSTIFEHLHNTPPGVNGEIQLTDAIANLLQHESIFTYQFKGKHFDCGNQLGLLKATIHYALERQDIKDDLLNYIDLLIKDYQNDK